SARLTPEPDSEPETPHVIEKSAQQKHGESLTAPGPLAGPIAPTLATATQPGSSVPAVKDTPASESTEAHLAASTPASPAPGHSATGAPLHKEIDPIWKQPAVTRKWPLATLTLEQENHLGLNLNALILQLNSRASDGEEQERVEEAARPLIAHCRRKDLTYRFF